MAIGVRQYSDMGVGIACDQTGPRVGLWMRRWYKADVIKGMRVDGHDSHQHRRARVRVCNKHMRRDPADTNWARASVRQS